MYKNIEAARALGVSESDIRKNVTRKGIDKQTTNELFRGVYTPQLPNDFFIKKMRQINNDLNQKEGIDIDNPYYEALPEIREIINQNRRINLKDDNHSFYKYLEEFDQPTKETTPIQPLKLPPSNASAKGQIPVVSPVNTNLNQATTQIRGEKLFENDITFS